MSQEPSIARHVPVLAAEVLAGLEPLPGCLVLDMTLGGGGHAGMMAARVGPAGRVIGLDCDSEQLERARARLDGLPVELVHARFDQAAEVLR
ncbi:MAG: 16S rRNA (cytosine(1402)-N(4))-methyltransferase, partial [Planctomycetota bacterium]